jgi:hypothetical protein
MKDLITIDTRKIKLAIDESKHFIFKPDSEKALLELKKYRDWINDVYDETLEKIGEAGKKANPNFKGVIGENVRCVYRKYGAKYKYEWDKLDKLEPFIKRKEWITVDSDKVDEYAEENGELPEGIYEPEREPKLSLSVKGEDE